MISRFRQFKKYDGKGENKKGPTLGGGKRRLEVLGIYTKDLSKGNSPIKQLSSWAEIPRFPVFSENISHRKNQYFCPVKQASKTNHLQYEI